MARYIHPEFGGFCLTTRFRRDIRLVAVSVLLGTMAGGIGAAIVGLNTSRTPATTSAHTALAISEAGISAAEGFSPRVNDIAQNSTTKAGAPTGGDPTPTFAAEISPGPKAACPGATPENEQGCSFFKPQRVRARTLTEVPDLGRIAVGRVTPSTTIATQNSAAKLPEAKPMEEISASVAARADIQADQATVKKLKRLHAGLGGMTEGWLIPPQAIALIRGSLAPKIMPRHLVDRMHGRLLLPAEAFGIGPGKARRWGGANGRPLALAAGH